MAVDEALLEAAASEGTCTLRFYQWAEPTLSLGYFQAVADRRLHEASLGCAMVRRQSGGGAILHDLELTYSLAVPERHPLAAKRLDTYRVVHEALIETLRRRGIEGKLFSREDGSTTGGQTFLSVGSDAGGQTFLSVPRRCDIRDEHTQDRQECLSSLGGETQDRQECLSSLGGETQDRQECLSSLGVEPFLCFERRAPGDVVLRTTKIAGSAQRRWRGAVLQHGSVLLAKSAAAPELDGIGELSGVSLSADELTEAWLESLASSLAIVGQRGELSGSERNRAAQLETEKYAATTAWTNAR